MTDKTHEPVSKDTMQKNANLGAALAKTYIAAQNCNQDVSNQVCDLVSDANDWVKWGFDREMAKSPYTVRAYCIFLQCVR